MQTESQVTTKRFRLLLIDDEELIRDALCVAFQITDLELVAVETAEEGLELVRQSFFDVIICDYRLPGMDGIEFFKSTRNRLAASTRILISAWANCCTQSQAVSACIDLFLEKPFPMEFLLAFVLSRLPVNPAHTNEVT